jgi:hypothetical protein
MNHIIGKTVSLNLPFEKVKKAVVLGDCTLENCMKVKILSGKNKGFTFSINKDYIVDIS